MAHCNPCVVVAQIARLSDVAIYAEHLHSTTAQALQYQDSDAAGECREAHGQGAVHHT